MTTLRPIPSPRPKQVISLEDWDKKALLSDEQQRSVLILQKACEDKSLPIKVNNDEPISRPSSPAQRGRFTSAISPSDNSRPGTPTLGQSSQNQHRLLPKSLIQTPQQFFDWFATIERQATHSKEAHFRAHIADVTQHIETCDHLSKSTNDVQRDVDDMLGKWKLVEANGKSLKESSEMLLGERDRLIELSEAIAARLDYFKELEHATRMLNHPGDSLILQADFLDMVERVDVCIEFLRSHPQYREAEVYLLRFQQCLTRAMTLIKMYFVGLFKALVSDITNRASDKSLSRTALTHLLYTRFHSVSSTVSPLLGELERRARAHPDQLSSLLAECHVAYFGARKSLLVGVGKVVDEIKGLDPGRADLVELTRSGCSYMKQLCLDEFTLYKCFFNSGKDHLYRFLETLCDYLYDDLRPRILHEARLSVLCEVCRVLQALMVLDTAAASVSEDDSAIADSDEDDDTFELNLSRDRHGFVEKSRNEGSGLHRLHLRHLLQSVLQDAQTRLFFKAQAVVQAEVGHHVPRPGDLEYPGLLLKSANDVSLNSSSTLTQKGAAGDPLELSTTLFTITRATHYASTPWYPPVKTTISVLEQMHDFVQPVIFAEIAKEALDMCRANLLTARQLLDQNLQDLAKGDIEPRKQIDANNLPIDILDADLFLIRHLLVLKRMLNDMNLESGLEGKRDIDDGPVGRSGFDFFRPSTILPLALTSSIGRLGQDYDSSQADVKERIDDDLRQSCERVISHCATLCSHNLPSSSLLPPSTLPVNSPKSEDISTISRADLSNIPSHILDILTMLSRRFRLYFSTLDSPHAGPGADDGSRTITLLLTHIMDRTGQIYEEAWRRVVIGGDMKGEVSSGEELLGPAEFRVRMEGYLVSFNRSV